MQTYLQIVNEVLGRLREATVATVTENTYSTLIGNLVNAVKREMEGAYYWDALRSTYSVNTQQNVTSYSFLGSGPKAVVIDAWNTTTPGPLKRGTNDDFNTWYFGVASTDIQTGPTTHFIPAGLSSNYDLKVDIYPKPDTNVQALVFNTYSPQADLSDGATIPLVPQDVLIEEVIARALVERGDEDAPRPLPGDTFIRRDLLSTAISRDAGHDPHEMDWDIE